MRALPRLSTWRGAAFALALLQACGSERPESLGSSDIGLPRFDAAAPDAPSAPAGPCAPDDPDSVPVPSCTGPDYTILLESQQLALYEGLVRAHEFYVNQEPMIADFVVCQGDYENPAIDVSLANHHYAFSYENPDDAPQEGYIVNIHAVPSTPAVEQWLRTIHAQSRVQIWGFEVDRIDYESGGWWTDAGCNTLLITHACVAVE